MIIGITGLDRVVMSEVAGIMVNEGLVGLSADLSLLVHAELEQAYPDMTPPGWRQVMANPAETSPRLALCYCNGNAIRSYLGAEAIANVDLYCSPLDYNEISGLWREMRDEMANRPYWIMQAMSGNKDQGADMCIANITTAAEAEIVRQSGGFVIMVATTETMGLAGLDDLSAQCSPEFTITGDEPDYIVRQIAASTGVTNQKEMIQHVLHRELPINTTDHLDSY